MSNFVALLAEPANVQRSLIPHGMMRVELGRQAARFALLCHPNLPPTNRSVNRVACSVLEPVIRVSAVIVTRCVRPAAHNPLASPSPRVDRLDGRGHRRELVPRAVMGVAERDAEVGPAALALEVVD